MEQEDYLKSDTNRLEYVADDIANMTDQDDMMLALIELLQSEVEVVPDPGRYYTFIYQPKTPRIEYDQYPLVAVTEVFEWGFKGLNYHWGSFRNYTWNETASNLYLIYPNELEDARRIPYQYFRINN